MNWHYFTCIGSPFIRLYDVVDHDAFYDILLNFINLTFNSFRFLFIIKKIPSKQQFKFFIYQIPLFPFHNVQIWLSS